MKELMIVGALAAMAAGCVTVNKNDGGDSAIAPNVVKDAIREKYEVGKDTVQASDTVNCLFGFICWGSTATHIADLSDSGCLGGLAKAKNGAYANACDKANCDSLVGTKYTITTDDYYVFKTIKVEVKGYPASITGVDVIKADKPCGGTTPATPKKCGLF